MIMIRRMLNIYEARPALSKLNIISPSTFAFTLILAFTFLSGCASAPQQQVKRRYFWPPLPEEPKVEWLASYASQNDFPKTPSQKFWESLVGAEAPKGFNSPWGIASNGEGKVYVVDAASRGIVVYDMNKQTVTELGGGMYAGMFKSPIDADIDASGNIYISDSGKNNVFAFSRDEGPLMTIGTSENMNWPVGIGIDRRLNRLYVANSHGHNVAVFDLAGGKHLFSFGGRGSAEGRFSFPTDVAVNSKGDVYVADSMNARIQVFDSEGKFKLMFGTRGDAMTSFKLIKSISINRDDYVFISDAMANRIMVFDKNGVSLLTFGAAERGGRRGGAIGGFAAPRGIYVDKKEQFYVVDAMMKEFEVFQVLNEEWLREHPIEK